jgi:ubiquinone/menaquinone biosynthesis C-methylase UbiE
MGRLFKGHVTRGSASDSGLSLLHRGLKHEPIDLWWDDDGIIPDALTPDTTYLFSRMNEATLEAVDARPGEKILDVGCGQGLDLISQDARGAALFGSDGSLIMIRKAFKNFLKNGLPRRLVCGSAEHLPFANRSFHKVYCKGAIDHFYDPRKALREMLRILKPCGNLVISVANFESLGCRLGRLYNRVNRVFTGRHLPKPYFWEIPEDHVYKFDHSLLISILPGGICAEMDSGLSLLWGFPNWGRLLQALPSRITNLLLGGLDRVARVTPSLADVLVVRITRLPS